jgi:hypothetical protein
MFVRSAGAVSAAIVMIVAVACSSPEPITTTAGSEAPSATSGGTSRPSGTTGTTRVPTQSGTTAQSTPGDSGAAAVGTWQATSATGPLADAVRGGGTVQCTFGGKNDDVYWDLRTTTDGDLGSIYLNFDRGDPDQASVEIMASGNKETLATGSASVSSTRGSGTIVSFSFGLSYRDSDDEDTGDFQGQGSCHQEVPNN